MIRYSDHVFDYVESCLHILHKKQPRIEHSHLLEAVFGGHTDLVHALVSAGADVKFQRSNGATLLSVASEKGHVDIVKLLVQSGAEVETRDNKGATPLYWAAINGHVDVVRFLIQHHANVNACNSDGQSCLLAAVFCGYTDIARALVSAGADANVRVVTVLLRLPWLVS